MRVLVTGATGFIGRALVPLLQRHGHTVVALVRSEARARGLLGADVVLVPTGGGLQALTTALTGCGAVVNLAGEPIMGGRWTTPRRRALEDSRVQFTDRLVHAMEAARPRPRVLISGSAVGYYGDRADETLTEGSPAGDGFLAQLCVRWEAAARRAKALGVRVVTLRTGVVLGRGGGALAQMLLPFRMGIGGRIGSGHQYLPWIHLHDVVHIIAVALVDDRYQGSVNGVAPEPATNGVFTQALGLALRRPTFVPVPALALRAVFGKASTVLLASQRVEPYSLVARGFTWNFPTLAGALDDILGGAPVTFAHATSPPDEAKDARYQLCATTVVDAPLEETFAFFSKAENLGLITPAGMRFSILGVPPPMAANAIIQYRMRIGGMPITWRTRIAVWEPGRRFVDDQEAGPYRRWWHEHTFEAEGGRTVMTDRVWYTPPLGPIGRLAQFLFIAPTLRQVFRYRGDVIRLRFGLAGEGPPLPTAVVA